MKRFLVAICFAAVPVAAHAVIIPYASRAAFDAAFPGSVVENWDGFAAGTVFPDGTTANGITYTSSAGNAVVTNVFATTTSPNGLGDTSAGFFASADTILFGFSNPRSAFGVDINTFAEVSGAYTATTSGGDVVGSVFNPFPGVSTGQFVGFSSDSPFSSITIAAASGFTYTLDTLRATSAVPEPGSLALLGAALASIGFIRRRKKGGR